MSEIATTPSTEVANWEEPWKILDLLASDVRQVVGEDDELWFVASDVAKYFGYRDANSLFRSIGQEYKDSLKVRTYQDDGSVSVRRMTVVSEPGLYTVALTADAPRMKPFRNWVTSEVLPSIRKHGAYITPDKLEEFIVNPDNLLALAERLSEENEKRAAARAIAP